MRTLIILMENPPVCGPGIRFGTFPLL